MTDSYLRPNKHKIIFCNILRFSLINLTTNLVLWAAAFKKCLLSIVCLCQDRAMVTARATGTAHPPLRPHSPARPPRPCPCRPGATQERPVPSTSTPTGTFAPGSGQHPTPSTGRTTRWDWFDALLFLIFSVENYSFPSMSLIYIHILSYVKQKIMKW